MSKFWRVEERSIPRSKIYAWSILEMENASCKSLALRWRTLILYSVGYHYLSSGLPFLCCILGQAEQLSLLNRISGAQDGKFLTSQHYLAKEGKHRALPQIAQRHMPWAEAAGSTVPLMQLHSELQLPPPGAVSRDVQWLWSCLIIKLILALEEKHLKKIDVKGIKTT